MKAICINNDHPQIFTPGKEYEATPTYIIGVVAMTGDNGLNVLIPEDSDMFEWQKCPTLTPNAVTYAGGKK
jgi:hypothetical protein